MTTEKDVAAWMPLWIGDYLADTMNLTRDMHGGYLLLLFAYWRNRGPLPDDDEELAAITKASPEEWAARLRPRLARFFTIEDGQWCHGRADKELRRSGDLKALKASKASAGGSARWGDADTREERGRHLRSQRLAEARKKATHTAVEWEAMKAYHGMKCGLCGADGELVKDHILPLYQGGSDGIENIGPLCRRCNCSKGPDATDYRKPGWKDAVEKALDAFGEGIECLPARLPDAFPSPSPSPIKEKTPPKPPKGGGRRAKGEPSEAFMRWWSAWPSNDRKVARAQCWAKWEAQGLDALAEAIAAHTEAMKSCEQWTREGGRFIPQPMTYLNQARWEAPVAGAAGETPSGHWTDSRAGIEGMGERVGVGRWDQSAFEHGQGPAWPVYEAKVRRAAAAAGHGGNERAQAQQALAALGAHA